MSLPPCPLTGCTMRDEHGHGSGLTYQGYRGPSEWAPPGDLIEADISDYDPEEGAAEHVAREHPVMHVTRGSLDGAEAEIEIVCLCGEVFGHPSANTPAQNYGKHLAKMRERYVSMREL